MRAGHDAEENSGLDAVREGIDRAYQLWVGQSILTFRYRILTYSIQRMIQRCSLSIDFSVLFFVLFAALALTDGLRRSFPINLFIVFAMVRIQ